MKTFMITHRTCVQKHVEVTSTAKHVEVTGTAGKASFHLTLYNQTSGIDVNCFLKSFGGHSKVGQPMGALNSLADKF